MFKKYVLYVFNYNWELDDDHKINTSFLQKYPNFVF